MSLFVSSEFGGHHTCFPLRYLHSCLRPCRQHALTGLEGRGDVIPGLRRSRVWWLRPGLFPFAPFGALLILILVAMLRFATQQTEAPLRMNRSGASRGGRCQAERANEKREDKTA